jgi:hypothetical protein
MDRLESGERCGEGGEIGAVAKAVKVDRVQSLVRLYEPGESVSL